MIYRSANSGSCPYCKHRHPPTYGSIRCDNCRRRFSGDPLSDKVPYWIRVSVPLVLVVGLIFAARLALSAPL